MVPLLQKLRSELAGQSNLNQRLVIAACLIPVVLFLVIWSATLFDIFVIAAGLLAYREWMPLVQTKWPPRLEIAAYVGIALSAVMTAIFSFPLGFLFLFLTVLVVAGFAHLHLDQGDKRAPPWLTFGILYIGIPVMSLVWLRHQGALLGTSHEWGPVIIFLASVIATDSAAYFAGKHFGRRKLAPKISPNKTIEGLLGGMVASGVVSFLLAGMLSMPGWGYYLFWGAGLAVVAQMGDLFESFMKRRAGVKDSGTLLPGHGGILDRIDGMLFAAPVFALLIKVALH